MQNLLYFSLAALWEIAGCYAFWLWLREGRAWWWVLPGLAALILFAYLLTKIEVANAGRTYAAYGGIYIFSSLLWLWLAEGVQPSRTDLLGAGIALTGTAVILSGARIP